MTKRNWPIKLYWQPYGAPIIISLGEVTSSFLARRRRQGKGGCLFSTDVNPQSPRGPDPVIKRESTSLSNGCSDSTSECENISSNGRVARSAVRLLELDLRIQRLRPLPPRISCGQIRPAIRQVFSETLTPSQELSIKTSQKLEKDICKFCRSQTDFVENWKKNRLTPVEIDIEHLRLFKSAVRQNIKIGWDRNKYPYIPNGSATLNNTRCRGGNWNREDFSSESNIHLVSSSGKPRIITMYSSYNTAVLTPLHGSLYHSLKEWGWLLVGSPTDELVGNLNGEGDFVSVDYASATDNIKLEYCRATIEVLTEKAERLTDDQIRCLNVVGNLKIDGVPAFTGQPMGSAMSFPILCIINKTLVDLAARDALLEGIISWKEFYEHRCLINGDDLLFREIRRNGTPIFDRLVCHGRRVGLITNKEKTMVDPNWAEINSTAFYNGSRRRKTNVGTLIVRKDVTDAIGFLQDSISRRVSFRQLMKRWAPAIRMQERKIHGPLRLELICVLSEHRAALTTAVSIRTRAPNLFPVVPMPDGYKLERTEEVASINARVKWLQDHGIKAKKGIRDTKEIVGTVTFRSVLKRRSPSGLTILSLLKDTWERQIKERLLKEDAAGGCWPDRPLECMRCYEELHSHITHLLELASEGRVVRARSQECDRMEGDFIEL